MGTQETTHFPSDGQHRGHNTRQARDEYTRRLRDDYNIQIFQKSARSPEVNALDLGIWMSVQSAVKCRHQNRRRVPDAFAQSVIDAWNNLLLHTIQKVLHRKPIVLQLIVDGNGDNLKVKDIRGSHGARAHLPE
jgi:hypothetical protein